MNIKQEEQKAPPPLPENEKFDENPSDKPTNQFSLTAAAETPPQPNQNMDDFDILGDFGLLSTSQTHENPEPEIVLSSRKREQKSKKKKILKGIRKRGKKSKLDHTSTSMPSDKIISPKKSIRKKKMN